VGGSDDVDDDGGGGYSGAVFLRLEVIDAFKNKICLMHFRNENSSGDKLTRSFKIA